MCDEKRYSAVRMIKYPKLHELVEKEKEKQELLTKKAEEKENSKPRENTRTVYFCIGYSEEKWKELVHHWVYVEEIQEPSSTRTYVVLENHDVLPPFHPKHQGNSDCL